MYSILSQIIKFNTLSVLGIYKTEMGENYYLLTVKKKGNTLNIISTSEFSHLDILLKSIDIKLPVLLVIDGKGVLSKNIDFNNEADTNWRKNIDFDSLYHTEYKTDNASFLSFSRKTNIDEIITKLQQSNLQIIDFYLGPLMASNLIQLIGKNEVYSSNSMLLFEKEVLTNIKKADTTEVVNYTFDNKTISQYHLPLYGAAIHFFLRTKQITKSNSNNIDVENIIYKRAFNYFGLGMLLLFFVSLLCSYFLIQYYSSKNIELNEKNVYTHQTYKHIMELSQLKERKMKILNETGQLSKNFLSYYIYQLSQSVPGSVHLNELNIFPVTTEIKDNEKVLITSNQIFIKGATITQNSFDNWLDKLKEMRWIKKFEIVSIKKDKKNIQQFEIKILINNV